MTPKPPTLLRLVVSVETPEGYNNRLEFRHDKTIKAESFEDVAKIFSSLHKLIESL